MCTWVEKNLRPVFHLQPCKIDNACLAHDMR